VFDSLYLLWPLLAAMLYAVGAQAMHLAGGRGASPRHANAISTLVTAVGFFGFSAPFSPDFWPVIWWHAPVMGLSFAVAQYFTVLSFTRGDVSLATPILSAKVLIIAAILAAFVGETVGWEIWVGAVFCLLGITALQQADHRSGTSGRFGFTLWTSLLAAAGFAVFDVLVQEMSKVNGFHRILPHALVWSAAIAWLLSYTARRPWPQWGHAAWRPLLFGSFLNSTQSIILITVIALSQDVAGCNIVYGSRGIWGVVVAWIAAHYLYKATRTSQGGLWWRLGGAGLIFASIVLVFAR